MVFEEEVRVISVKAHLVIDDSGFYSSVRSRENIILLFDEVNRIWSGGNIVFQIEDIDVVRVTGNAIPKAINSNYSEDRFSGRSKMGSSRIYLQ